MDSKDEACIICLSDLPTSPDTLETAETAQKGEVDKLVPHESRSKSPTKDGELLANLRPCNHHLHNECLKQWTTRTNSCPLCREKFNTVELSAYVDGPIIDSYTVKDKHQVVELDPSFLVGDDWAELELEYPPCMVCDAHGDDSQLMLCDGCDNTCHTHCADLDELPSGQWFCMDCMQDLNSIRARASASHSVPRRPARSRPMTIVERERRERERRERFEEIRYNRLREGVYAATGLDIDFPHQIGEHDFEAEAPSNIEQREAHRRNIHDREIWQRRLQIARTQGAGRTFERVTRNLAEQPTEVPREEVDAWKALDRAYGIPSGRNSKRCRSRTPTPVSEGEPRKYKRPRTVRMGHGDTKNPVAESSTSRQAASERARPTKLSEVGNAAGGNFLQSLLNEVQSSGAPESPAERNADFLSNAYVYGRDGSSSPQASSPASPSISNYATPRSMTPPISPAHRPSSPGVPITRSVTPLPRPAHTHLYSPIASGDVDRSSRARNRQTPSHSPHVSPLRITSDMKSDIQKMVGEALKPYYKDGEISKEEYTGINRDVSRLFYDKVGDAGGLGGAEAKRKWQEKVTDEVRQAIEQAKTIRADGEGDKAKA